MAGQDEGRWYRAFGEPFKKQKEARDPWKVVVLHGQKDAHWMTSPSAPFWTGFFFLFFFFLVELSD